MGWWSASGAWWSATLRWPSWRTCRVAGRPCGSGWGPTGSAAQRWTGRAELGVRGHSTMARKRDSVTKDELRQGREPMFRRLCQELVKNYATRLFEQDGIVYAETDGVVREIHRAVNPRKIWFETWLILRDD